MKSGKKKGIIIAAVVVVALGAGSAYAMPKIMAKKSASQETSTTIASATAEKGSINSNVTGTGKLTTSDSVDIKALSGLVVDEVKVEKGDTVTSGQVLATVTKASVAKELTEVNENLDTIAKKLASSKYTDLQKEELTEIRTQLINRKVELNSIHETLEITATSDGIVSSINLTEGAEIGSSSGSSGSSSDSDSSDSSKSSNSSSSNSGSSDSSDSDSSDGATQTSASISSGMTGSYGASSEYTVMTCTTGSQVGNGGNSGVRVEKLSTDDDTTTDPADSPTPTPTDSTDADDDSTADPTDTPTPTTIQTIENFDALQIPVPETGEVGIQGISEGDTSGAGYKVTSITWNCNGAFQEGVAYTATIELKALDGYQFSSDHTPVIDGSTYSWTINSDGSRMTIVAKFAKTDAMEDNQDNQEQDTQDMGDASGSGSSSSSSSSDEKYSVGSYNTSSSTVCTLSTSDSYKVSLSVSELDILSIKEGQTATVTLDAISGQEYTGTVTNIDTQGNTSGSTTKYTVDISIPKDDNMMLGMSASATINIAESDDAVLIPLSALQSAGGKSFVYTKQDGEGNLSGKVDVETGLSNDSQVEITSGLSEGDTVYYMDTSGDSSDSDTISYYTMDTDDMGGGPEGGGDDMGGGPGGDGGGDMGGGPGGN